MPSNDKLNKSPKELDQSNDLGKRIESIVRQVQNLLDTVESPNKTLMQTTKQTTIHELLTRISDIYPDQVIDWIKIQTFHHHLKHFCNISIPTTEEIPLMELQEITHTQMGNYYFKFIHENGHVVSLQIEDSNFKSSLLKLPDSISQLSYIRKINIAHQSFTTLPDSLGELQHLQELIIEESALEKLPDSIGNCRKLTKITIRKCKLQSLPASIGLLQQLQYLALDENQITIIPPEIGNCQSLITLSLSKNYIIQFPLSIGQLQNLTALTISNNKISQLPPTLINNEQLGHITANNNELSSLPANFGTIELSYLDLGQNKYIIVPPELFTARINSVNLSGNLITQIPAPLLLNEQIDEFGFQYNNFTFLTADLKTAKWFKLDNFQGNPLNDIDESLIKNKRYSNVEITEQKFLTLMDLISGNYFCQYSNIASHTGIQIENHHIKAFGIHDSKLRRIPDCIGQLSELTHLDLAHNELESLPETIMNCKKIFSINISHNKFKIPPWFVSEIQRLTKISVMDNPWDDLYEMLKHKCDSKTIKAIFASAKEQWHPPEFLPEDLHE